MRHTEKVTAKLRAAAETIQSQNVSLEQVNHLLRERSTAAMESLTATVDARDAYTAGHSRRVQKDLARDRRRARPLAGGARAARVRGALPRHRQAGAAGRDPAQAGAAGRGEWALIMRHPADGARSSSARLPQRRRPGDPPPPRALRRPRVPRPARGHRHPARRADHPRGRCFRLDALREGLPPGASLEATLGEIERMAGVQFCPRCAAALRAVIEREKSGILADAAPACRRLVRP